MLYTLLSVLLLSQIPYQDTGHLCVRSLVVPQYPRLARLAQLQGTVKLELEIGNDGKVLSVRASGAHPLLLREAESNVRQWLFSAPSLGASNKLRHTVEFVYRIEGKELYHDPQPRIELFLPDKAVLTTNPSEPQP